jgi:flagellar protein FlaD
MESEKRISVLENIEVDSRTNLIMMRWLSFLMDRLEQEAIPHLLDFYCRIGWMGEKAAKYLSEVADGTKPLPPIEADLADARVLGEEAAHAGKRQLSRIRKGKQETEDVDWRLTPDDHMKSWMFIMEIAGLDVDKNIWVEAEQRMGRFERELAEYYRL